jgi:membrane protein DedA with SNARE-associated domain
MTSVIEKILAWAMALIIKFGYGGIFLTMMLESAAIPIPSEVVLPFSGFLASSGKLSFWVIVAIATLANLVGSVVIFYVGHFGGRTLLEKYGKYILIHRSEIEKMDRWLEQYGARAAFFSRLLPGVRTFSSLVIGASRMNLKKFIVYTFAGSLVWNLPLVYIGYVTGNNWDSLRPYFHKFELVILALVIVAAAVFIFRHIRKGRLTE